MKTLIVGGFFGDTPKQSELVIKLEKNIGANRVINGGKINDLPTNLSYDLNIWMPEFNSSEFFVPSKNTGSILIVSKDMNPNDTFVDAVEQIIKMNANAVIAIYKEKYGIVYKLIDSLGNELYIGSDICILCDRIYRFYDFSKNVIRYKSIKIEKEKPTKNQDIVEFINITEQLHDFIKLSCGDNMGVSIQCSKLTPTIRINETSMFVSPRSQVNYNVDDMIYCEQDRNGISYIGNDKPSIISPIQLSIFRKCKNVNFMIHGYSFIEDDDKAIETKQNYPCGDLRETNEIASIIETRKKIGKINYGAINLKKHGFLLYADNLTNLENLISDLTFTYTRKKYSREI